MPSIFQSEHFTDLIMLAAALGLAAVQKAWRSYRLSRSQTWPVTHGNTLRGEASEGKLKLFYAYRVGENSFQGEFEKKFRDEAEAQWWADALVKKQIAVHYDPDNPQRSELWESDLVPIVQAFPPRAPAAHEITPFPFWERLLVIAGILLALVGCTLSFMEYIGYFAGKTWVPPEYSSGLLFGGLVIAGLAGLERKRVRVKRASPEWMSFSLHALLYLAILTTVFLPPSKSGNRSTRTTRNPSYQVLLYFGAFESFYLRLKDAEQSPFLADGKEPIPQ